MFCFKCGSKQSDTAKFCGICGTKLAGLVSSPEAVVPAPPPVVPAAPSSIAPRTPPHTAALPPASLTVEQWEVTGHLPDGDGDSRFEAKAVIVYEGDAPASLARLRWIAYDPTGRLPLFQAEADVTRDIDDGDDVELEASSYGKLGMDVTADACRVEAQVLVFPGERQALLSAPLPEAGVVGGRLEGARVGDATLVAWKVASAESSEESASYSVTLVIRNNGATLLAAVTVRLRVTSRKGDDWTKDYVMVEGLAPGEVRSVEMNLYVSERARARKGATLELVGIVCPLAVVHSLAPAVPALAVDDASSDDDGSDESGVAEPDPSDDDGDGSARDDGPAFVGSDEDARSPLRSLENRLAEALKTNDYVNRLVGSVPDDFIDLAVRATWRSWEGDQILHTQVTFIGDGEQVRRLRARITDDDVRDGIDSGVEDECRAAFIEVFPTQELGLSSYGGTKLAVKRVAGSAPDS